MTPIGGPTGQPRRQHYLPASFLGNFSKQEHGSRRKRMIVVGDKRGKRCFRAAAGKVAAEKDFYTVQGQNDPVFLERIWAGYENRLARAIEELVEESIDALTWAGVLVPFVSSLLVRGPDFGERFEARLKSVLPEGMEVPKDNTNLARSLELQRLLAPILAAQWIVAEAQGAGSLITNDMAFAGFRAPQTGEVGLAVPLSRRHVLQLVPTRKRVVATAKGGRWLPEIEYRRLSPGNHLQFNAVMAIWARRFIFGPDEATVSTYLHKSGTTAAPVPDPGTLGSPGGRLARVHEFTWHHLISVLTKSPDDANAWNFSPILDYKAIASVWKLMVVIPLTSPMFPPGLSREGNSIIVDLYDVEGLTDQGI